LVTVVVKVTGSPGFTVVASATLTAVSSLTGHETQIAATLGSRGEPPLAADRLIRPSEVLKK